MSAISQIASCLRAMRATGGRPKELRVGEAFLDAVADECYAAHNPPRGVERKSKDDWRQQCRRNAARGEMTLFGVRVVLDTRRASA